MTTRYNLMKKPLMGHAMMVENDDGEWVKFEDSEVEFIKTPQPLQVVQVRDGDVLVIRHPNKLSEKRTCSLEKLIEAAFENWGLSIHALVLEEGMDIGTIRINETTGDAENEDSKEIEKDH